MSVSQASKSGVCLLAMAVARRRTSALCSSSTSSFFLHSLSYRQITELFAQAHQLVDHAFKLAHSLNLLAIEWNQRRIGEADRYSFTGLLAGQQRIRTVFDAGPIGVSNRQELLGQGTAAQLTQVGELAQEPLTLLF